MAKKTTARVTKRSTKATAPATKRRRKGTAGARKRSTSKRETINTGGTTMYGKRTTGGRFKEMDDVGWSLSADPDAKQRRPSGPVMATRATARHRAAARNADVAGIDRTRL